MPLEILDLPSTSDSAPPAPAPLTVDDVVRAIAGDASLAAGDYLRDTEVPHGGE